MYGRMNLLLKPLIAFPDMLCTVSLTCYPVAILWLNMKHDLTSAVVFWRFSLPVVEQILHP